MTLLLLPSFCCKVKEQKLISYKREEYKNKSSFYRQTQNETCERHQTKAVLKLSSHNEDTCNTL